MHTFRINLRVNVYDSRICVYVERQERSSVPKIDRKPSKRTSDATVATVSHSNCHRVIKLQAVTSFQQMLHFLRSIQIFPCFSCVESFYVGENSRYLTKNTNYSEQVRKQSIKSNLNAEKK